MKVYRLCRQQEIDDILNTKDFSNVGHFCTQDISKNTHKYNANKKYLHFFQDKSSLLYLNTIQDRYICTYDIPKEILKSHIGEGKYLSFINYSNLNSVKEYAIECDLLKFEYLMKADKIIACIDYENHIGNTSLSGYVKPYYISNKAQCNGQDITDILLNKNVVKAIRENLNDIIKQIPEIEYMIGFDHKHPHHHLDVWEHTLMALSLSPNDLDIRIALLLHDIGKPHSFIEGEVRHYNHHAEVSADMAEQILDRLGFDDDYIAMICKMIKFHDTPLTEQDIIQNYGFCEKLFKVQTCDALSHNPQKNTKRLAYIEKMKNIFNEYIIKVCKYEHI